MHEFVHIAEDIAPFAIVCWVALSLPIALLLGRMVRARELRD
jgi:hypothetical protein